MRTTLALLLTVALSAASLGAQTDYRNLDAGRPLLTEDAYAIPRYAFEFTAPFSMSRSFREHRTEISPQLAWGFFPNMVVNVEWPFLARTDRGESFRGRFPNLSVFANFNSESTGWPAIGVRAQHYGTDETDLTGIATRSFGRWRMHFNASVATSSEQSASEEQSVNRWATSLATDVTLWRSSLLLAGEVQLSRPIGGVRTWRVGAGARWQFTPTLVLDLGGYRSYSPRDGRELGVTFGITQEFGISAFMPRRPSK